MNTEELIKAYIASQTEAKRSELEELHHLILEIMPACQLWFLDGRDANGKTVSNPNIGYGLYTIHYADGKSRDFYQIGLSANTTGISVYIMGIEDKNILIENFGNEIGKASVTGYCIKFKTVKDIHLNILKDAIRFGITTTSKKNI